MHPRWAYDKGVGLEKSVRNWGHSSSLWLSLSDSEMQNWEQKGSYSNVTFYNHMDYSTPGFPVLHHLPALAQTHVHWFGDAIQQSHSLSPPSPSALNLSQHQGLFPISQLFASGGQSIIASASASGLPVNIQGRFPFILTDLISLLSKGIFKDSCPAPQLESISFSAVSLLYGAEGKWS